MEFEYDSKIGFEENFKLWYNENSRERRAYNQEPHPFPIGKRIFTELYGNRILEKKDLTNFFGGAELLIAMTLMTSYEDSCLT